MLCVSRGSKSNDKTTATHLLHLGRQQVPLLALGRSAAYLAHQFIQLLLVEDALTLALQLECGSLGQGRLVHDAASDAAPATEGRAAGAADPPNVRNRSRHLGGFLVEDFRNRQLGLQVLPGGLRLLRLRWVRVRMALLLLLLLLLPWADHVETRRGIAGPGCGG